MDGKGWRKHNSNHNGRHDDNSTVMDSGVQWQWTARGQLNGDERCLGDTMTMDDKEGASTTAMSTWPTTEATKANAASRH